MVKVTTITILTELINLLITSSVGFYLIYTLFKSELCLVNKYLLTISIMLGYISWHIFMRKISKYVLKTIVFKVKNRFLNILLYLVFIFQGYIKITISLIFICGCVENYIPKNSFLVIYITILQVAFLELVFLIFFKRVLVQRNKK